MHKMRKYGRLSLKDLLELYIDKVEEMIKIFQSLKVISLNKNENMLKIEVMFYSKNFQMIKCDLCLKIQKDNKISLKFNP